LKKLHINFAIVLLLLLLETTAAIDTTATKYFPLKVGNTWVFEYRVRYFNVVQSSEKYKAVVLSDTVINGQKSYRISNLQYVTPAVELYRVDSSNGAFTKFAVCTVDSLGQQSFNSYYRSCTDAINVKFKSANYVELFGVPTYDINIESIVVPRVFKTRRYARGFGLYSSYYVNDHYDYSHSLLGCVIDGVLYGDTSIGINGMNPIGNVIPSKFNLVQNYPNPFNPSTLIQFDIASSGHAALDVFDVLGRKVATLVDERLKPGKYEVLWEPLGMNSGIYFCILRVNNIVLVRKMAFLK
jgi:hypothetical protein